MKKPTQTKKKRNLLHIAKGMVSLLFVSRTNPKWKWIWWVSVRERECHKESLKSSMNIKVVMKWWQLWKRVLIKTFNGVIRDRPMMILSHYVSNKRVHSDSMLFTHQFHFILFILFFFHFLSISWLTGIKHTFVYIITILNGPCELRLFLLRALSF